ncbi:peptide chain release factor N(5)-glutamine methyltransferase [Candidatus Babeliales bacterium]|nr:peptide chain release factor N(5)-glutamine methyltransferase [Candidatus Babeliales bacterium]
MNIEETFNDIKNKLSKTLTSSHDPEQEALWLLEKLTGKSLTELLLKKHIRLTQDQQAQLNEWIEQRTENNKPIQYILGTVPFCGLEILIKPPVLIPRPETEYWCTNLIKKLESVKYEKINILDLCSGSGCIALSLAKALPNSYVTGSDIEEVAINLANENKAYNKISNVKFIKSDLYQSFENKTFDLIISNPPYVSEEEWNSLSEEITKWENKNSFVSENNGLKLSRKIIEEAANFLHKESILKQKHLPRIVMEIDEDQNEQISKVLAEAGFTNITVEKDLANKNRVILAEI